MTEGNTANTLFNDNIELSTSIVDHPVKESIVEPEKENQEEPVVCESKPEPIVEEAQQFSHPVFAPLNSLEVATQQIDEACREA